MSISGSLEDVSVADVMQFIHLGQRTGTLVLSRADEQAMIGFHSGKLVSAQAPGQERLGELLVDSGILDDGALQRAIEIQQAEEDHRSLGQILVANGDVNAEELRKAIAHQIETTVAEAVTWDSGSFEFVVDDLRPVDDIALYPGDVVPNSDINTQMVLLEAARIFDEKNRQDSEIALPLGAVGEGAAAAADAQPADEDDDTLPLGTEREAATGTQEAPREDTVTLLDPDSIDEALEDSDLGEGRAEFRRLWIDIISSDDTFAHRFHGVLPEEVSHVGRVDSLDELEQVPAHLYPVAVVDLRGREDDEAFYEAIQSLHRARPRLSVIALAEPGESFSRVYHAGARAALPADPDGVVACLESLLQIYRERPPHQHQRYLDASGSGGVARLRRVFGDLRSGLISATVALNLMHIISESVERAVLFLVKRDEMVALGAFGTGQDGKPLAEVTRGLKIPLDAENALSWTYEEGEAQSLRFEEADLPEGFVDMVGCPKTGQVVIFPVLGAQRVISVIYTDNGEREEAIEDIEILELATAQVGMAFENELLRRQISQDQ